MATLEQIRSLMEKHGLTTADIDAHSGSQKRGPKRIAKSVGAAKTSAVQYQDPKTGATWSGRGRAPGWITAAKERSRFLVKAGAASPASVAASQPKATGNYVRGPQPAKYKDPKSGATWSGRGPTPAWLAGAKDRNKFLIDGAVSAAQPAASSLASKPAAKKAMAKNAKVAGEKVVTRKAAAPRAAVKSVVATKKAARKAVVAKKSAPAPAKKSAPTKGPSTKTVVKKASARKVANPKTSETASSGPAVAEALTPQSAE